MQNKYLYAFLKDNPIKLLFIFSLFGITSMFLFIKLDVVQTLKINDLHHKQTVIAQIPSLKAKIASMKVVINGFTIGGIVTDKAQPMVVINDTLLKVGEEIEGKKVVKITENSTTICNINTLDKCIELILEQ